MTESKQESGGSGFLGSLWSSLSFHIEERAKSPFAGAFLFSWLAVNWKPLLILAFSSTTIEKRIEVVAPHFQELNNIVVLPLGIALVLAICYYLVAVVFLGLSEAYRLLSGWVQRKFELREWLPAPRFALLKAKYLEKIEKLSKLAADNTDEITSANARLTEAQLEAGAAKSAQELLRGELSIEQAKVSNLVNEKSVLEGHLQIATAMVEARAKDLTEVRKYVLPLDSFLGNQMNALSSVISALENAKKNDTAGNLNALARLAAHPERRFSDSNVVDLQRSMQSVISSLASAQESVRLAVGLSVQK